MAIEPLDHNQQSMTEQELNHVLNAPKEITRYAYNAKDLQGIRYVEGMNISGGIKYIREDLVMIRSDK